jgi:FtsX-like permease family protein
MPDWASHVRPRLSPLRLSPTRENEIVEELSQHLDDRWRELVSAGSPEDEATRLALAEFRQGNLLARYMTPLRQAHAAGPIVPGAPAGHVLNDLWQDLRYAARLWLRQPGFASVAVLSLALGIGVTTAMFTIVYGVLLRDLPYPEPDRLMRLVQAHSGGEVTMREYEIVKQHARTFDAVAAYRGNGERAGDVLGAFVRQGFTLTTTGVLLGLVAAWFVVRLLSTLLFGVLPHDPASFAVVALVVIVVGCAASYVPARRVAAIDPLVAMRAE